MTLLVQSLDANEVIPQFTWFHGRWFDDQTLMEWNLLSLSDFHCNTGGSGRMMQIDWWEGCRIHVLDPITDQINVPHLDHAIPFRDQLEDSILLVACSCTGRLPKRLPKRTLKVD